MRGRISEAKSYAEPVQIGQVMVGSTVGTVIESRHPEYRPGDVVVGYWGWQEYAVSDGQGVERCDAFVGPHDDGSGRVGDAGTDGLFRPVGHRPAEARRNPSSFPGRLARWARW